MRDIQNAEDIALITREFYHKAIVDPLIGFIFTEIAELDLEKHLPVINSFWENALFHNTEYKGNVMKIHKELNMKIRLESQHFDRWLELFNEVVDTNFSGAVSNSAKNRALSIATVMQMKINN